MNAYTYVFLTGKRVHLNFHMHWSTVFKIFPMIFIPLPYISSAVLAKECRGRTRSWSTLSLLWSSPESDLC